LEGVFLILISCRKWEPSDLFQFYYDTTPIVGSLDELLIKIDKEAVDRAIKIGACNIYHGCYLIG